MCHVDGDFSPQISSESQLLVLNVSHGFFADSPRNPHAHWNLPLEISVLACQGLVPLQKPLSLDWAPCFLVFPASLKEAKYTDIISYLERKELLR